MEHLPAPHAPVRMRPATACLFALLMLVPASAAAQKDPFIDAFIGFHSMLFGTYGDEGPKVAASPEAGR